MRLPRCARNDNSNIKIDRLARNDTSNLSYQHYESATLVRSFAMTAKSAA